jgi:hypothetical protein
MSKTSVYSLAKEYIFNISYFVVNNLEDDVRQYLNDVKAKVQRIKKGSAMERETLLAPIIVYIVKLMRLPLVLMYYIYILPFLMITKKLRRYFTLIVRILCRKSPQARHIVEHIVALFMLCKTALDNILSAKLTELVAFCIVTLFEVPFYFNN